MNKGFFSVAIIVFIFIISIFFFTLNSQKEIYFSDSYRQMIFDSEQAYALINKELVDSDCSSITTTIYGSCNVLLNLIDLKKADVTLNCNSNEYSKTFNFLYDLKEVCDIKDTEILTIDPGAVADCIFESCSIYVNADSDLKEAMELCANDETYCDALYSNENWTEQLKDIMKKYYK